MIKSAVFILLTILSVGYANASCIELRENKEITVSTSSSSNGEICITLRDLHPTETYFMVDKSYPDLNSDALVGYDASWTLSTGNTVYNKNIYTDFDMVRVNLQSHDKATLKLKKAQNGANYDYTFDIINNREAQGFSIISIAVRAKLKTISSPAPPPGGGGGGCNNGMCMDPLSTTYPSQFSNSQTMLGDIAFSSVSQCNAGNMPPSPAPYSKNGKGEQMNFNNTLRTESTWRSRIRQFTSSNPFAIHTATYQRLYQNHKTGGIFDVKSDRSFWHGDADFGNFLYGSIMFIHSFSEGEALRYSAAYQGIQNHDNKFTMASISQGIYNYITNTGDGEGDREMVLRGYNYAKQIHNHNRSDTKSLSCVDERTINNSNSGGNSGGGEGGTPVPGGGSAFRVHCELWYFSKSLSNGQFYLEKNCNLFIIP